MTITETRPVRIRLELLTVPDPCPADWSAMAAVGGDGERVRHCRHCDRHVYDLSALPRAAAERLVADHLSAAVPMCVRMIRRADGTVTTADCRGRWRQSAARWAARWGGPIGAALSVLLAVLGCDAAEKPPTVTMGGPPPVAVSGMVATTQPADGDGPTAAPATQPVPPSPQVMGRMGMPRPTTRAATPSD
jgi:hypothetical protein